MLKYILCETFNYRGIKLFYPLSIIKLQNQYKNKEYFFKIAILALLYFISGKLSIAVIDNNFIITIGIFAAEGFSMAAVLIFGKKIWPGVFIGQLLISFSENMPFLASLWISSINSLELFIVWYAFHTLQLNRSIETIRDILGLFFIIIFIAQPFSAFFNTTILYLFSITNDTNYWFSFFSWWFGNTMGQLLFAPSLLLLYAYRKKITLASTLFLLFLFSLLTYMILFITPIHSLPVIIAITMPVVIYIATIRNVLTGSLAIVLMSIISMYAAYKHVGIFSIHDIVENLINLNFFILSHILIVLTIGTLYHENIRTQKQLAKLNESLEKKVKQQVEKLNKQNILMAQQARLASMGEMLGMIAHQWRQPLNRINSNIAVISSISNSSTIDHKMLQSKIDNVKNQTEFMSNTIEDFADFFHPDKKKVKFMPLHTIDRALKLIHMHTKNIDIDIKAEKDIWLYSFENEYLQVVLTILHNAMDNFNTKEIQTPEIKIILQSSEETISLHIHDNGGGITSQEINTIFEPYFTTNCTGKNSGLGLYMAKILVEDSMHGQLSVTNQVNGAHFEIMLPKGEKNA
jgi:signal transduction histidine kinase